MVYLSSDRFAFGYFNGQIEVHWKDQFFLSSHYDNYPVTCMKISQDESFLYIGGFNGALKAYRINDYSI